MNSHDAQTGDINQRLSEWLGKFESQPDCKTLFEGNKELADLFPPTDDYINLFTQNDNFPWLKLFAEQIKVARWFADPEHQGWAKLFFPHSKWRELFEAKTNQLMEKFDAETGQWGTSLKENPKWFELFAKHPEWAEKLLDKPGWYTILSSNLEFAKQIAENQNEVDLFDLNPNWSLIANVEHKEINRRRREKGQSPVNADLVGLAFSGGGIRSATFGLGVLEALRKYGLLDKIDYLSTVSGGGYIGSWLSANCQRNTVDWINAGKTQNINSPASNLWNESIRHLRNYSNYLSPRIGFFSADTWTIATVWLRNTLLIQLTVVFLIATLLLMPRYFFHGFLDWPNSGNWRWSTVFLFLLAAAGIAHNSRLLVQKDIKTLVSSVTAITSLILVAILVCHYRFNPFDKQEVTEASHEQVLVSAAIALFLMMAGYNGLRSVSLFRKSISFQKASLDYSQNEVQWLIVFPMMTVCYFVASVLWQHIQTGNIKKWQTFSEFLQNAWLYWPFQLTIVSMSIFVLSYSCYQPKSVNIPALKTQRNSENKEKIDNLFFKISKRILDSYYEILQVYKEVIFELLMFVLKKVFVPFFASLLPFIVLYASISAIMFFFHNWIYAGSQGQWLAYIWIPPLLMLAFAFAILLLFGMLGRDSTEGVREWWSRLGAWLSIYGFAWMAINVVAVYGPWLLFSKPWQNLSLGSAWIGSTIAGIMAGKSNATNGAGTDGLKSKGMEIIAKLTPFVFIAGLLISVSTVLHYLIVLTCDLSESPVCKLDGNSLSPSVRWQWDYYYLLSVPIWRPILLMGLSLSLLLIWRVDINEFSFNRFYCNRLVRCFLGATRIKKDRKPQNFTGFDDEDDMPLADLKNSQGPYHIVNCALNLGGTGDLSLHSRHSASFTLTPHFFGSDYKIKEANNREVAIGYNDTAQFCQNSGQPTLGQAIAVSGAAANPNMGYHTSPVTAFLMTLFNVRLGWWFPNPHFPKEKSPSPLFGLKYLIMELFGSADAKTKYVSVSDGGHFENLAAYELIKRKCKVIIISDGECDPEYEFEGLGKLIRLTKIDFGVNIDIDARSIRPGPNSKWSRSRCAVGTIDYGDYKGTLIYLKASMNGNEAVDILQYRATHSTFPHETTGDQFYSEDQFESYRTLGRDIANKTFKPLLKANNLVESAETLQNIWSPLQPSTTQFSHHADRLMDLWGKISGNPVLKSIDEQLVEDWPKEAPKEFRSEFYLCSELIQLMENVYIDLNLEETWMHPDNKGWRSLFTKWGKSEIFQRTWKMTDQNYGTRFRYFCDRELKLPYSKDS